MESFGNIKSKILKKSIESYGSDKKDLKKIVKLLTENRNFKNVYLFYERIETEYFEDKETANYFLDEVIPLLKENINKIGDTMSTIEEIVMDVELSENSVYDDIDILLRKDSLSNIADKVRAKKRLIEHLTTEKIINEEINEPLIENENLLYNVLSNNFNVLYSQTMNEDEQKELRTLLNMDDESIELNFQTLKESTIDKINNILNENNDNELKTKLMSVKENLVNSTPNRLNYYKLIELKNGLD